MLGSRNALALALVALLATGLVALAGETDPDTEKAAEQAAKSEHAQKKEPVTAKSEQHPKTPAPPSIPSKEIRAIAVPTRLRAPAATYVVEEKSRKMTGIKMMDPPQPKVLRSPKGRPAEIALIDSDETIDTAPPKTPGTSVVFDSGNFVTNQINTSGALFIPPDSMAAAGPSHVVAVTNVSILFHTKDGTITFNDTLRNFFNAVAPLTFTFDPRVLYDHFEERWVVFTAEQTDTASGDPANTARVFVAVSDDSDPNGSWTQAQINVLQNIDGKDTWADFPAVGYDDEGIYITTNQFGFFSLGATYHGVRLWVLDKGVGTGGIYDGGFLAVDVFNPFSGGGIVGTIVPTIMRDTPPFDLNNFLVGYGGLSDGFTDFLQTIRIDDALTAPVFTQQFIPVGNIEDFSTAIPDPPQAGTAELIDANNRRALQAVWRNNHLYTAATIAPPAAGDDGDEATAHWWDVNAANLANLVLDSQGNIGGEEIAPETHTFFPSIDVTDDGVIGVGFSASAATIFPGAYFLTIEADGTQGSPRVLREGVDFYIRKFGGATNRWGDYSGTVIDPADDCFWFYNEYAMSRGTPTSGQDGRWATTFGKVCPTNCGDGKLEAPGEECDDGNAVDDDACNNECFDNFCGDGAVNNGEECDDGNEINEDDCRNDCTARFCGDGIVDTGETCEMPGDPAGAQGLPCRDDCTVCGDGIVNGLEDCDDGDADDGNTCSNACTINICTPDPIVMLLSGDGPTTIIWNSAGDPFWYDMVSGFLSGLKSTGDILLSSCFSNNIQTPMTTDPRPAPVSGEAYYYLIRPQALCGAGDYGYNSSGGSRGLPWTGDCN